MKKQIRLSILAIGIIIFCFSVLAALAAVLTNSSMPLQGKGVDRQEVSLGNLAADAMRSAAQADAALMNASQIRQIDLPAGPITDAQVAEVLAYPDEPLAVVKMKPDLLKACLERSVCLLPQPNKSFLQVSGLTVKFDSSQPTCGRVVEITLGGRPLENREYRIALPYSMAKGAGGYISVLGDISVQKLDSTLQQAVVTYLQSSGAASGAVSGRLVDLAKPKI